MRPSLILIAGPNGSGKSTLYATRIASRFRAPFINADVIQRDELRNPSMEASYEAAQIAAERRTRYLTEGIDFATETVFSHPSKLDIIDQAKDRGFDVMVFHVNVNDPTLSIHRVRSRVVEGGHNVPPEKIVDRYHRSEPLIRQAILRADRGFVYDNSALNSPPRLCLTFKAGTLNFCEAVLPQWVLRVYAEHLTY